jgi:Protein of unknown function (DUF2974)
MVTTWSKMAWALVIGCIAIASPARADWFTNLLAWGAIGSIAALVAKKGFKSKDELLLHLQDRSTTAIQQVRHDRSCDLRRRDFDAILPLAAEAAFLASTAYDDPQTAGPGVSQIQLTAPSVGPRGAYATALRTALQGYPLPDGFPRPASWGQSPNRSYDAVFVTYRGTDQLRDWGDANIPQFVGAASQQYQWALRYAQDVLSQVSSDTLVVFSGHSLGGSLATYSALRFGRGAITFNPAGLHPNTLIDAVGDISQLKTSDITNIYHFLSHSEDGVTDLVGNLSFAGYMLLLPGAKYFINISGFSFGSNPSFQRYKDLHLMDPLWREIAAHRRHARPAPSCTELHGRAIYMHP